MNKTFKKLGGCLLMTSLLASCSGGKSVVVSVHNPLNMQREGEMVEVNLENLNKIQLKEGEGYVVLNQKKEQVPCQITHDNLLIFPATVSESGTSQYTIRAGKPEPVDTIVCGRYYAERADDIAWENDKAAYRAYGPALQRNNEKAYGYDVFTKSVSYPVVEKRYALELDPLVRAQIKKLRAQGKKAEADSVQRIISYHVDHGNGMDVYSVGPTLGGGTAALMDGDEIVYPYCYKDYAILDNGPLRFTVKLVYNPIKVKNDANVIETRVLSLDKGSYLNRTAVTYDNLSQTTPIAAGPVLHPANPKGYEASADDRFVAYADSTDNPKAGNGVIYVGAAFPEALTSAGPVLFPKEVSGAIGHVLGIAPYQPGSTFVYYWGSGWSKGDMKDMNQWTSYLKAFSKKLASPLEVTVK